MIGLIKFFIFLVSSSLAVLDPAKNVLREAPVETKYFYSILLSLFWCLAFGLYVGEFLTIGYNMIGHVALISMAFLTWWVFYSVKQANQSSRDAYEAQKNPGRFTVWIGGTEATTHYLTREQAEAIAAEARDAGYDDTQIVSVPNSK